MLTQKDWVFTFKTKKRESREGNSIKYLSETHFTGRSVTFRTEMVAWQHFLLDSECVHVSLMLTWLVHEYKRGLTSWSQQWHLPHILSSVQMEVHFEKVPYCAKFTSLSVKWACDVTKGTDSSPRLVTAPPARWLMYSLRPPCGCLVFVPLPPCGRKSVLHNSEF